MDRRSLASVTAGVALLVGAPIAWQVAQPADEVGEVPDIAPAAATDTDEPSVVLSAPTAEELAEEGPEGADTSDDGSSDTGSSEVVFTPPPPAPEPPRQLRLPTLGVEAPVLDVGLEESGGMEIPEDISKVGWYELGVTPGAASGTAVISGHVDDRVQGRGALWDLRTMDVDDPIEIEHADGTTSEWRVVARRSYPKTELPLRDIFTRFGEPRLVLITCGGEFDREARSYSDNVVVYAVPTEA